MNRVYNQKLHDAAKAIFKGKLIALKCFLFLEKKKDKNQQLKYIDKEIFLKKQILKNKNRNKHTQKNRGRNKVIIFLKKAKHKIIT